MAKSVKMTNSTKSKNEKFEGITKISVGGYKSIANPCSIEIQNLTILSGANSSGKSSIMQPLLLLKQTLEATYDPGALLLNGSNVRFTSTEQFFSKLSSTKRYKDFFVETEINQSSSIRFEFYKTSKGIDLKQMVYQEKGEPETILRKDMTQEERKNVLPKGFLDSYENLFIDLFNNIFIEITQIRCFLETQVIANDDKKSLSPIIYNSSRTGVFEQSIRSIIHVPGLRGNPERTYPVTAIGQQFPGTFENYVASVINNWQTTKSSKLKDLARYLSILGLTGKVDTKQINDTQVEIRVARLPCNFNPKTKSTEMVSIADVGFGVSQTLPALVALLVAEPEQLVYLEQPEIHLHPRAQAALADILVESANRGVRVVIETHSDLILKRIQSLVAEDKIKPDKIKLHWFTRDQEGCTNITTADLDEAGTFGDWPEDFSEVDLQEESRYLDAAELKLMNESNSL
ncbi:AAA family ATPase [Planktothrix mougeotii]|uniref:AAA family ATPase n=1 Tax=Planktothrix mougeotii LEGE 06226 TaxID=1828728 RepID=A0ABR9UB94_9CYAN|nr:AAA family ATPase [Planktothrix mougeotii]MBE9143720.1 AAA family ATPase [Planktothrix mougeotii LEGE 06226]